mgnify:CR=1 FL=1
MKCAVKFVDDRHGVPARPRVPQTCVISIDFTQEPVSSGPLAMTPFSTWNFQFWFRDPQGGQVGFNLTDALEVTFCD